MTPTRSILIILILVVLGLVAIVIEHPSVRSMLRRAIVGKNYYLEARARFGYVVESPGDTAIVRFVFAGPPSDTRIAEAPYGETPVFFEQVVLAVDSTELAFVWPGREHGDCRLHAGRYSTWEGRCVNPTGVSKAIGIGLEKPPDLGRTLEPTNVDVQIIDRALGILSSTDKWHKADERICTGDRQVDRWSLFCALYQASLDVTGAYLHRRPAMRAVREAILDATPGDRYAHIVRDYNNRPDVTLSDVRSRLSEGRAAVFPTATSRP